MTARPIRYQRQVSDRKGKIFYTSITSLSHISKIVGLDLAALHPQQVIFPLSCHAGGFQVVRDIADRGHTVLRGNHLLAFTLNIAGGYQL